MSEWQTVTLKETVLRANTGADAIKRAPIVAYDSGIRCIRIQNLSNKHDFEYWGFCEITPENRKRFSLKKGDILIARTGNTIGVNKYIHSDLDAVYNNGIIRLKTNKEICLAEYIYYLFQTQKFKDHIKSIAYGTSTQPNMQIESLLRFQFELPSIDIQQQIVATFSVLDRKIENHRKQNETLESIAQNLFKHWFIDFEFPNTDGKSYKSSGGAMEPSELGDIPVGWRVGQLKEILTAQKGLSYKGEGLADAETGIPMHNLKSIHEGGGYQHAGIKFYKGEYKARHLCCAGDIIVCNTEQGEKHKLIAYPARIPKYFTGISIYTHHISKLIPHKPSEFSREFIYYLIFSAVVRHQILTFTNGTTVNMLPVDGLEEPLFAMPPTDLIITFSEVIIPIWDKTECNHEQIQTLTKTRDVLLPKLMSGKLRVKD